MRINIVKVICFFWLLAGCVSQSENKKVSNSLPNQIINYLAKSDSKNLKDSIKFYYARKAYLLSTNNEIDSLISKSLFQFVKLSYPLKEKDSFLTYYPRSLYQSKILRDTLTLAQTHNYTAYFYQKQNIIDSSFYHFYQGSKYFKNIGDDYQTGKMLLNMAIIQKNQRDYRGSEETSIEALKYLLKTNSNRYKASIYNNLGIVNNELNKVDVALKYHRKALDFRKLLENKPILILETYNNIAVTYKNNGQYKNAIKYLDSIGMQQNLLKEHPIVRARFLDNLAHTKLLKGDLNGVLNNMKLALSIRKKENHITGIMISLIHLSEYYKYIGEEKTSYKYAIDAKNLSKKYYNYRDEIRALEILTLNKTSQNRLDLIREYHTILDTLNKIKNRVSDSFARIRFEADEKDKIILNTNKALKRKTKFNTIYVYLIILICLTIAAIFFYRNLKLRRIRRKIGEGFDRYLKEKYSLTEYNLEFWKIWVDQNNQNDVAEKLSISLDAVKSRRKSLKKKLIKIEKIEGDFNKSKAIKIYNRELNFFKEFENLA